MDYESNKELKKLQFYGAGPKAALPDLSNEGITFEIKKIGTIHTLDENNICSDHYFIQKHVDFPESDVVFVLAIIHYG